LTLNENFIKYERQREEMVRRQIQARGVTDPKVLEAMSNVPRHLFVSEALRDQAYGDFPLPIGEQQTISQPYIVAEMTQALQPGKEDRILEIGGTGSGYQAAVLAEIVFRVYTIEKIHSLYLNTRKLFDKLRYHNIVTKYSDGTSGWSDESPFDGIIVTAGAPGIPKPLVSQLAVGGRMVIPVGDRYSQELIKLYKDEHGIHKTNLGGCRFVKLVGEYGWKRIMGIISAGLQRILFFPNTPGYTAHSPGCGRSQKIFEICFNMLGRVCPRRMLRLSDRMAVHGFSRKPYCRLLRPDPEGYDAWAVGIAGFTPIPYKVFTIAAGAFNINFSVFLIASCVSRSARFFLVGGLIYVFGPRIQSFIDKYFNILATAFTVLLVAGFLIIKYLL